jgi:O-antigen/teichoic acid export membrane protein
MFDKTPSYSISRLVKNKSIQNFIFLGLIQSSNILISLISMPLLIQSIGIDQFGLVNLALSVIILANYFVDFGFSISGPREVAINYKNKEVLSVLFSEILFSRVVFAFFSMLAIFSLVWIFDLFYEYQTILVFSTVILFSEALLPLWFFQGLEKLKFISIANIFGKLLFLLGIVLFIHDPKHSIWVNFMLGVSTLGVNLLLLLYIHYTMDIKFYSPPFQSVFQNIIKNVYLFLSNLASYISVKGGILILSFYSTAELLGMYSVAERPVVVLRIFPAMVVQAIYPKASRLYLEDQSACFNYIRKSYFLCLAGGFIISLMAYVLAPFIVFLLAKQELKESVEFLKVMSFIPFLACLNIVNVLIFFIKSENKLLLNTTLAMALFMVVSSTTLIHQIGEMGVAYALLLTELFIFVLGTLVNYIKNRTFVNGIFKFSGSSNSHS